MVIRLIASVSYNAFAGLPSLATTCHTYAIDSDRWQRNNVAQVYKLVGQDLGSLPAFYTILLRNMTSYDYMFILFTLLKSVLVSFTS